MLNTCAEIFADHLKSEDLNFKAKEDNDGDSVISIAYKGKTTQMFFAGEKGTYLSMYIVYESIPEDKVAKVIYLCNKLHAQYKWVTFYVDKDNDLILHNDAILSVGSAADEAFELFLRMANMADELKPQIMKTIYG